MTSDEGYTRLFLWATIAAAVLIVMVPAKAVIEVLICFFRRDKK